MTRKCQEVVIQFIIKDFNEEGVPVGEVVTQPMKLFRGLTPDVWGAADSAIEQMAANKKD